MRNSIYNPAIKSDQFERYFEWMRKGFAEALDDNPSDLVNEKSEFLPEIEEGTYLITDSHRMDAYREGHRMDKMLISYLDEKVFGFDQLKSWTVANIPSD